MGVKIPAWQAAILYHIEEGTVMNGNPATHNGSTIINLDKLHIEGEIRFGGHALELHRHAIEMAVPTCLAISLVGQPLSALAQIPPTGIEQIDTAIQETKIESAEALSVQNGGGRESYRFELTSPELDLEKVREERKRKQP
tara:strand:- start:365 stop:787 length:423 start_codon:yes stop_codon:yes gene_type:complete